MAQDKKSVATVGIAQLESLLAHSEETTIVLRRLVQLLRTSPLNGAMPGWVAEAMTTVDRAAKTKTATKTAAAPPPRPAKKVTRKPAEPGAWLALRKQQQAASAAFLSRFNPDTPVMPERAGAAGTPLGVLVRRGYLRKVSNGYLRTDKAYEPTESALAAGNGVAHVDPAILEPPPEAIVEATH